MVTVKIYSPFAPIAVAWRYKDLVIPLARRKVSARYRGSVLGMFWAVLSPVILLGIYTFIFSVVLQVKWNLEPGSRDQFALFLFSGMILYSVFSDCLNEAPSLMIGNKLYIRQLVFPVEVLPWVSVLSSLFSLGINFLILMTFYVLVLGPPSFSLIYLPLTTLPIVLLTLGGVWFFASIGVYLRDLGHVVGLLTTALLFLSPIFYPVSVVPADFRAYYEMNPFVHILEMSRGAIFHGAQPDWVLLAGCLFGSWLFAWLGYSWFMTTKKGFADVV
jgi:lipopolysaccharide transport system permease protein